MDWREQRARQAVQRADRVLAAHGFEDSARLVQRVSPKGTSRRDSIVIAFVICLLVAFNWGWVAVGAVTVVWFVGFGVARLRHKPTPLPPPIVIVVGRIGRYVDDGTGSLVCLSEHARIDFGSLWYTYGFAVTVTDGDREWVGEADIGNRGRRLITSAWSEANGTARRV